MLQPIFKKEEKPAAPAKKEAPVKTAASTASQSTVASVAQEKQVNWEDLLPPIAESFNLFEFKTLIVNHADKREALQQLWKNWDDKVFSFYVVHYQKVEGEGEVLHVTNNLLNGFIQRMDDKMRRHCLCVLGVYGEEPALEIMGVFFWRGTDIIEPMKEHPQYEYYTQKKLDIKGSSADRELVERFWATKEEESLESPIDHKQVKCQTKKYFK